MRPQSSIFLAFAFVAVLALPAAAQQAPPARQAPAQPRGNPADTEVWEPVPKMVAPGATRGAPPSDAVILFDGTNLDQWVSTKDKSPAKWKVADGVLTVDKSAGNIETKRSFTNYQIHIEWRIPADITGTDQARGNSGAVPRVHRRGRRRLRAADSGFVQQQDLRQRSGRQHLQAGHPARERQPQAGRMADLRRDLDGANFQRRRIAENAGLRHGIPQRRAGAEPRRVEGGDASTSASRNTRSTARAPIKLQAHGDPSAADQLPQYLGARALGGFAVGPWACGFEEGPRRYVLSSPTRLMSAVDNTRCTSPSTARRISARPTITVVVV